MARRCTVCAHPQRAEIDRLLATETPYRNVAGRFGTSVSALVRHKKDHLPVHLARAVEAEELAQAKRLHGELTQRRANETRQALDVLQQLKAINAACLEVLGKARAAEKHSVLLGAVDRIHRQIELQAKLLGDLQDGPTVNVLLAPEWHEVRRVILVALQDQPEARLRVTQALEEVSLASA